jgi:hypothetical protein
MSDIGSNLTKIQALLEELKRLDKFDREDAEVTGPKDNLKHLPVPRHRLPTLPSERSYLQRQKNEELERKRRNNILITEIKKKPTAN